MSMECLFIFVTMYMGENEMKSVFGHFSAELIWMNLW